MGFTGKVKKEKHPALEAEIERDGLAQGKAGGVPPRPPPHNVPVLVLSHLAVHSTTFSSSPSVTANHLLSSPNAAAAAAAAAVVLGLVSPRLERRTSLSRTTYLQG